LPIAIMTSRTFMAISSLAESCADKSKYNGVQIS
jgi:hypothetical protein